MWKECWSWRWYGPWIGLLWAYHQAWEAWHAAIHGVAKSQTWLSNWTELNHQPSKSWSNSWSFRSFITVEQVDPHWYNLTNSLGSWHHALISSWQSKRWCTGKWSLTPGRPCWHQWMAWGLGQQVITELGGSKGDLVPLGESGPLTSIAISVKWVRYIRS